MNKSFKSGFVAFIGRPNVGKSTLLNKILKEKVAIVSPRPQTTRNKITGVFNDENSQIVFIDTPGIHQPKTKLGQYMISSVNASLQGIDALCFMLDASDIRSQDHAIIAQYQDSSIPLFILVNKIDLVQPPELLTIIDAFKHHHAKAILPISAFKNDGIAIFLNLIKEVLPHGPQYFPPDMLTDMPERHICAELIREKALLYLKDEVPHGIGVEILAFEEQNQNFTSIHANIYCERESHKRIIIGKNGQMIRKIGSEARVEIEALLGTHVNLDLWIKVRPGWRNSSYDLKTLGYTEEK